MSSLCSAIVVHVAFIVQSTAMFVISVTRVHISDAEYSIVLERSKV